MRARILAVVAVVMAAGVAAAHPAVVVSAVAGITQAMADARYLLLSGGSLTGAVTSTAQIKSTLTPAAAAGFTTASAFDTAPIHGLAAASAVYTPLLSLRDTGATNSGIAVVSSHDNTRSPYLVANNGSGSAQMYSSGNTWQMTSAAAVIASFASAGAQINSALDLRDSLSNAGANNGGAVKINDILLLTSATYAGTDCDASTDVGRVVMHNNGANKITMCVCEQSAAATYGFATATEDGDCP